MLQLRTGIAVSVCLLAASLTVAQAPAQKAPSQKAPPSQQSSAAQPQSKQPLVHPVFENERVRVIEVAWEPGAAAPRVKQEGTVTYGVVGVVTRDGTLEYTSPRGKKTRQERKRGEVFWQPGNTVLEARQNVSNGRMNMVQVALKKGDPSKAYIGPAPSADVKKALDNPRFAAFENTLAPGAKLPLHRYGPRVWVILDGGDMRSTDKAGKPQVARFGASQLLWLPAQEQALENIGATPLRIISIELK